MTRKKKVTRTRSTVPPPLATTFSEYPKYDFLVTVPDAGTTSAKVDLRGMLMVGIFVPSGEEGTSLTFQASPDDGATWFQVLDETGAVLTLTVAAGKYNKIDPTWFLGIKDMKIVAATQTGPANFILATRPI